MRRILFGAAVLLALGSLPAPARAQFLGGNGSGDPFFLYYGWFLPRQQALSMQPRPATTLNAMATLRQDSALVDRAGLFAGATSRRTFDPNTLFDAPSGGRRMGGTAAIGGQVEGNGPSRYYNRTSAYYPGLRTGRGVNPSIAVGAAGGGGGGRSSPMQAASAANMQLRAGMMPGMGGAPGMNLPGMTPPAAPRR
jgi:hypothetical protein